MPTYEVQVLGKDGSDAPPQIIDAKDAEAAKAIAAERGWIVGGARECSPAAGDAARRAAAAGGRLGEFRSSRPAALFHLSLVHFIWPKTFTLTPDAIETNKRKTILFPWVREEERMPLSSIASVAHRSGVIWDTVVAETRGGANTLDLNGLRKSDAKQLANALRSATA